MGIADIINQGPPRKSLLCAVGSIAEGMEEQDRNAVYDAIERIRSNEPGYSASWLHRVLISEGHKIGQSTLLRHVAKGCACESN